MRDFLEPRNNSVGFLRLALASIVLFGHGFELGGYGLDANRWGVLAVIGFFFLSGMLVAQSFERSRSGLDFLWRRSLRVYPGFWANLIVTAFVLIPITWMLGHGGLAGYWSGDHNPFNYVFGSFKLVTGFVGDIRHIFDHNPVPAIVNGSLWTLPIEFICYVALCVFGMMGALRWKAVAPALTLGFFVLWIIRPDFHLPKTVAKLTDPMVIELYVSFSLGVTAYVLRDKLKLIPWLGWTCTVFSAIVLWNGLGFVGEIVRPITTSYMVLWLAAVLPLKQFDKKVDLSYGVYIYAFPVQQSLVYLGVARRWPLIYFAASALITALLALASWTFIERPALQLKRVLSRRAQEVQEVAPQPISA